MRGRDSFDERRAWGSPFVFLRGEVGFAFIGAGDHHPLQSGYGHAKPSAYSDNRNFSARGGSVTGVLAKAEIPLARRGHAYRLWDVLICADHRVFPLALNKMIMPQISHLVTLQHGWYSVLV
jgi:hypothetical protein